MVGGECSTKRQAAEFPLGHRRKRERVGLKHGAAARFETRPASERNRRGHDLERALALDLSRLSAACSNSVEGLVGVDFLSDQVVQIDYAAQKLRLLAAKPPGENTNSIPLEARRCGLRVAVSVNGGKRQWVRLDTGCATALQWVTTAVPPRQCASKQAVAFSELSIPQTTTSISLGRWRVEGVPTGLHREAIFPGECGLLGNELLARFGVVTIDAKNGRLILGPRSVE